MQDEKLKSVVELMYKENPDTRDNNSLLCIKTLQYLGFNISIDIDHLFEMPQFEAITRVGREIKHNNPNYKESEKAERRKEELEQEYHMKYAEVKKSYPTVSKYIR